MFFLNMQEVAMVRYTANYTGFGYGDPHKELKHRHKELKQ